MSTNVHTTHPQRGRPVGRETPEQTLDHRAETATLPASGGGNFCDAVVATARNPQGTRRSHRGHELCTGRRVGSSRRGSRTDAAKERQT